MSSEQQKMDDEVFDPRVPFAAERTLLAWIRTGLALMGFGYVAAKFGLFLRELAVAHPEVGPSAPVPAAQHVAFSLWAGTTMVALGVMVNIVAAVQHARFLSRFRRGKPWQPGRISFSIVIALLLAMVGAAMAAYLIVMR